MKKQAKQAENANKMLTPRQMYQSISETIESPPEIRRLVSDAKRDYKETRKNRDGVVLKLGNDRIKMILEAVPGEVYRFVNEPLVRVK